MTPQEINNYCAEVWKVMLAESKIDNEKLLEMARLMSDVEYIKWFLRDKIDHSEYQKLLKDNMSYYAKAVTDLEKRIAKQLTHK